MSKGYYMHHLGSIVALMLDAGLAGLIQPSKKKKKKGISKRIITLIMCCLLEWKRNVTRWDRICFPCVCSGACQKKILSSIFLSSTVTVEPLFCLNYFSTVICSSSDSGVCPINSFKV